MAQVITFEDYQPPPRYDGAAYIEARIDEGPTADGPWDPIDTITLDPADAAPENPAVRNLTTENADDAAGLWYRVVFVDATGDEAQPTTPIQNLAPATPSGAFCGHFDLADRLGIELTADERTRADALLARASGVIRDETNQTIDLITDDEYQRPGTSDPRILLPQRPVISVASVAINDTEISDWSLVGNELVRGSSSLLDPDGLGASRGFGSETQTLTIVYTHGYATIPQTLTTIALEMAVRVWVNPGSVVQESIAGEQATYAPYSSPPRGLMLTDSERATLRRMFGRRARSVTIAGG